MGTIAICRTRCGDGGNDRFMKLILITVSVIMLLNSCSWKIIKETDKERIESNITILTVEETYQK